MLKNLEKYKALSFVLWIVGLFSLFLVCVLLQLPSELLYLHVLDGKEVLQAVDLHLQELDRFLRLEDDLVFLCELHAPARTPQPFLLTFIHPSCVAMETQNMT